MHCKVTPVPSPILSHTHLKCLLHTRSVCYLPACVCVCVRGLCPPGEREGPTSCVKLPLTFHTLPRSASLGLFFPLSCSFSLSSSLYGGLCQLSEAQNTDSFHELNMILKNTTLFRHTHTHTCALSLSLTHTHTVFKERGLARTSIWQWSFTIFEPTHRQMDSERSHGGRRKHTQTCYPWDTTDVCGKIGLPCKI